MLQEKSPHHNFKYDRASVFADALNVFECHHIFDYLNVCLLSNRPYSPEKKQTH